MLLHKHSTRQVEVVRRDRGGEARMSEVEVDAETSMVDRVVEVSTMVELGMKELVEEEGGVARNKLATM